MSTLRIKATIAGSAEVMGVLEDIKAGVRNRVLKAACRKQAGKAAKVAKSGVRGRRSGQLAKSIGQVYRKYKRGKVWVFVAGPRKGFRIKLRDVNKAGRKKFFKKYTDRLGRALDDGEKEKLLDRWVDPVRYAHFVEGGRKAVRPATRKRVMSDGITPFGRHAMGVGKRPFMEPAAAAVTASRGEMTADIWDGIDREAAKYAKRGKDIRG